jgi:hypothetical protein
MLGFQGIAIEGMSIRTTSNASADDSDKLSALGIRYFLLLSFFFSEHPHDL